MHLKDLVPIKVKRFGRFLQNRAGRLGEKAKYILVRPEEQQTFYIVSSERNAGRAVLRCLNSVYEQYYPRDRVRHILIDDESTDGTDKLIQKWLADHSDHNVEYIHNSKRVGGCANNLAGFRMAPPGSIIAELNGDDWLPDSGVLSFINMVYKDKNVWTTYNSRRFADGSWWSLARPYPKKTIAQNSFRDHVWLGGHLRTFRAELFSHLHESSLIDPETGEYWANADDLAYYWSLLELAGFHSRHIYRVTQIHNITQYSECHVDPHGPGHRTQRIRQLPRYKPLETLTWTDRPKPPDEQRMNGNNQ